MTQFNEIY